MKRVIMFSALVLALLAGVASASDRMLQQHVLQLPNLQMPPLQDFLPPLDQVNLPPLEEFLKKAGLPQWNELGLPPIQDLLKPAGGARGITLPALTEFAKQADVVMNQVVMEMLPPELKALIKVKLPKPKGLPDLSKFNLTAIAQELNATLPAALQNAKLPPLGNLPSLDTLAKAVASKFNVTLPFNLPKNLPPMEDIVKGLQGAQTFLKNMPKPDNMPSWDQILQAAQKVAALAQAAQGASAAKGALMGAGPIGPALPPGMG